MIEIKDKTQCSGCSACAQKCPKQCIEMVEDKKGFLYPKVDKATCVQCGLCEKVCIELNQYEKRTPLSACASKNKDESVRGTSSSGGIFTLMAEKVIEEGGVVFGVRFDENWECVHDYIESKEDIHLFRGSKYLPSKVGASFKNAEHFLKEGRKVLFTGTPCQIAGLNRYLNKEYENLLTVDVVCHGVPSPAVWRRYKDYMKKQYARKSDNSVSISSNPLTPAVNVLTKDVVQISGINFRSKRLGWKRFSFDFTLAKVLDRSQGNSVSISLEADKNPFMRLFIYNVILRPSCYNCPAKAGRTQSDITVGDFWHINDIMPDYNDDKGVTLAYLNTEKGSLFYNSLNCDTRKLTVKDATERKYAWHSSFNPNPFRNLYFIMYKCLEFNILAQTVTDYRNVKVLLKIKKYFK